MFKRALLVQILFISFCTSIIAGDGTVAHIDSIVIRGNKKTKERIVHRELDFNVGDSISVISFKERMELSTKRLYNTGLFNLVEISFTNFNASTSNLTVVIDLIENLYIYPVPIFELADRNFNVWWNEQNRSFKRVNYGVRLDHLNTTGAQDRLKIKFQRGYTRKYEIKYDYPYIFGDVGLGGSIFYSEQKEIPYITQNNKPQFFQAADERIMLRRFRTTFESVYRPNLYTWQNFKIEFHRNSIDELVAQDLNPNYFLNGKSSLKFFLLEYNFDYNRRVFNIYPEGGYRINVNMKKEGLGIFNEFNNLPFFVDADYHIKLFDGLISSTRAKAKANLIRNEVAFANNTGIGYGNDVVGGYELYVLDGTDYFLNENQLKFRFFNRMVDFGKIMPVKGFKKLNIQLFLRANFDLAYVNEPTYINSNNLNNKWIIGYGPAIDVLLFHNFLFKFEYSYNQLGESGLYISNSLGF